MTIVLPAWRGGRYVQLAELLLVLGKLVVDATWVLRVVEVAPGDGEVSLDTWDPARVLSTFDVLHLFTPDVQLIDGELESTRRENGEPWLVMRAVDSTTWDIETADPKVARCLEVAYPGLASDG